MLWCVNLDLQSLLPYCSCVGCGRLQDKGVGKDAEWGSLLEKPPLRHADDTDSATLSHAIDIFVERHHLLWKVSAPERVHMPGFWRTELYRIAVQ